MQNSPTKNCFSRFGNSISFLNLNIHVLTGFSSEHLSIKFNDCEPHPDNPLCNSPKQCEVECRNGFVGSNEKQQIRFTASCVNGSWDQICVKAICGDNFEIQHGYQFEPFNATYGCNTEKTGIRKCRCNEYGINRNGAKRDVIAEGDSEYPELGVFALCPKSGDFAEIYGNCRIICPNSIPKTLNSRDFVGNELQNCIKKYRCNSKHEFCSDKELHCKPKNGKKRKLAKYSVNGLPGIYCDDDAEWVVNAECVEVLK